MNKKIAIPIEISARHIHLSQQHVETLFGKGSNLQILKKISQPEQFAAVEIVKIIGPKKSIEKVRVVGPVRQQTQLEISITDCIAIGVDPKVFISGDLDGSSGGVRIVGLKGEVELDKGVIVSARHLHISPQQAKQYNLKHLDIVSVAIKGQRGLIFNNVVVRSRDGVDELALHLDTDEANAAGVSHGDKGWLVF